MALPHVEACWLKSMHKFLACIQGPIMVDNAYILPLQCEHYLYLMDTILQSKYFRPKEIQQINYCRLYLQAITLSDLTKADGRHLDPHMLVSCPSPKSSRTLLHRTNQG
jgi:hypothetical protein